ncbi:Cytosolic Ca2-dependent cysteine protease (calpain), large subunit (EF-Hand protein superfamily) [Plasmopara halstedii]|uniref:Cytosolic Ca2-dependent cysteine protease (Calpain), large subunit (EF-Hand protein superfamily) n=1 Tax=Plasmopara halstedii TaxID=4781 RepID=A0A0P1A5W0_PLAHL|nr:Cytosolic Ca2-dependent cysteine protease (calpain), large subunit (EF-Hand protein superfamily) [Plasmopara halstedii]CEG35751.1 Cytosolic Ca2-dependent cysteine protease (calpain), large subunit (EF-Hand protein superfamily) [Plasmopara halstedii]|eukprot:XP_024572120.1 Cytosolic Ca2-dependent cysteine protease (calpain), large subunit (EF-Hand protein superfamily) [Plasmopara halstedii]
MSRALTIEFSAASSLAIESAIIQKLCSQQNDTKNSKELYEDPDFPSNDSSLYFDPKKLPDYALSIRTNVFWYRPNEYTADPDYFKRSSGCGLLREGLLNDAWLLGVFAALALHPDNLIEQLFVSESLQDFKHFGVYTCRFYKDENWISVTTDTRIPYSMELPFQDKSEQSRQFRQPGSVLYGSSCDPNEVYIPLLEKAYAKLHGSYQILDEKYGGGSGGSAGSSTGRILEAFLDCTGGSAHCIALQSQTQAGTSSSTTSSCPSLLLWKQIMQYHHDKCIITTQLRQLAFHAQEITPMGILKNRQYVIHKMLEINLVPLSSSISPPQEILRLIKLQTVWGRGMWKGDWSNDDTKWDEYPHVEETLRSNLTCNFSRSGSDGCFWMNWEDLSHTFTELFVVHIFHSNLHQYCIRGDWIGPSAGGGPKKVSGMTQIEDSQGIQCKEIKLEKTRWSWVHDGDPNWHRNPQFRLSVPFDEVTKTHACVRNVLISLTQHDIRLYGGDNYAINFVILRKKVPLAFKDPPSVLWECNRHEVVAEAHSSESDSICSTHGNVGSTISVLNPSTNSLKALPEREVVKENITLSSQNVYYVVPYTTSSKVEMEFFLRIVASHPIRVERVPELLSVFCTGRWRSSEDSKDENHLNEFSSAGGPLLSLPLQDTHVVNKTNATWCQNPQFWIRFANRTRSERRKLEELIALKSYVTIKLVLRKTSHRVSTSKSRQRGDGMKDFTHMIGITALRATSTELVGGSGSAAATHLRIHLKSNRTDFLGESIVSPFAKAIARSTKRNEKSMNTLLHDDKDDENEATTGFDTSPLPTPKLVVHPTEWCRLSSYTSPSIACLYLQKVPKEWLYASNESNDLGGLIVVPTLGTSGIEGSFELQVDSEFPLVVDEISQGFKAFQCLPGEWTKATAKGCHLHSEWQQNPNFELHFQNVRPTKVQITLTRSDREWKSMCQRDPVGTMIGFYCFPKCREKSMRLEDKKTFISINGRAWRETEFVPFHSVTSPQDLMLPVASQNTYVIIPATYEPGKVGKFILSVQCDTDFILTEKLD